MRPRKRAQQHTLHSSHERAGSGAETHPCAPRTVAGARYQAPSGVFVLDLPSLLYGRLFEAIHILVHVNLKARS